MASATVNGIDIHYRHSGNGPRLLFLNGSGSTLAGAALMVDRLAEGFDFLAHDQRGLGLTSIPEGPYSMADYAADAFGLMDHVGWDSCRIVGVSFGGMVAQELAVTAPGRVERLGLLCTSPGGENLASYPLHELAGLGPAERAAVGRELLDTRFTDAWLAEHPGDRMITEVMAAGYAQERTAEQLRGEALQMEARRHHDVYDRLDRITSPTLVASGRFDGIAPPANGEAIAARIPGAELRLYEGGHAFFFQDPAAFGDITTFLAED